MKEGWEYKKLGEIATEMYRGSGIKRDQVTKEGTPCVRYGEIYTTYNTSFDTCVSHTNIESITSPKYFEHGDLLFAITGESVEDIGKTIAYLGDEKCLCGGDIICMKHRQNPKYLAYALSTPDAIRQKGIGKTKLKVVHTNAPALKAISIPLAPLPEQQSIVDYLDSAFAKIDAMKANAEKALNEAKALFQASLKEMLEPKEGWEEKKVGDVAEIRGGKRLPKGEKLLSEPTNHMYIRVTDFNEYGTVDLDDIQYISDKVYEQIKRYIIKKEDIYISIAGTIGKSGIVPDELDGANLTENACRLILSRELNQRFMYYITISPEFIRQEMESTKISAQPKLALTRLADILIAFPPFSEQQSIVETLDSLKSKVDRLQENYNKISQECDALKQAILRQVFE